MYKSKELSPYELLEHHIKPEHNVAVFGGFNGPLGDPSVLSVGMIQGRSPTSFGNLYLVDSQSQMLVNALNRKLGEHPEGVDNKKRGEVIRGRLKRLDGLMRRVSGGFGDSLLHKTRIREMRENGLRVNLPKLIFSNAEESFGLPDNSLDVIIDRGTSSFIFSTRNPLQAERQVDNITHSLLSALKRGGKLISFHANRDFGSHLINHLREHGMDPIEQYPVETHFHIPLTSQNLRGTTLERFVRSLGSQYIVTGLEGSDTRYISIIPDYLYNHAIVATKPKK